MLRFIYGDTLVEKILKLVKYARPHIRLPLTLFVTAIVLQENNMEDGIRHRLSSEIPYRFMHDALETTRTLTRSIQSVSHSFSFAKVHR